MRRNKSDLDLCAINQKYWNDNPYSRGRVKCNRWRVKGSVAQLLDSNGEIITIDAACLISCLPYTWTVRHNWSKWRRTKDVTTQKMVSTNVRRNGKLTTLTLHAFILGRQGTKDGLCVDHMPAAPGRLPDVRDNRKRLLQVVTPEENTRLAFARRRERDRKLYSSHQTAFSA